jgi:hypothetical protein
MNGGAHGASSFNLRAGTGLDLMLDSNAKNRAKLPERPRLRAPEELHGVFVRALGEQYVNCCCADVTVS